MLSSDPDIKPKFGLLPLGDDAARLSVCDNTAPVSGGCKCWLRFWRAAGHGSVTADRFSVLARTSTSADAGKERGRSSAGRRSFGSVECGGVGCGVEIAETGAATCEGGGEAGGEVAARIAIF